MNALDVLCAQLTRDLFAIAKFLLAIGRLLLHCWYSLGRPVTIGTPMVWSVFDNFLSISTVYYSSKTVKTQSKQHKNDHWCTSRHMSTNTIPTVYQKQSKQQKMTFGVPIVTGLPRLYKQCNNCLPIVNKNLAIANRSRVSCAHNTSRAFIDLNITP